MMDRRDGNYIKMKSELDVKKVIKILETADGGCSFCVSDLLKLFKKEFPSYNNIVDHKLKKYLSDQNSSKFLEK